MGIVGQDTPFTIFDDDKVKPYLDAIEGDSQRAPNAGSDDPPGPGDDMPPVRETPEPRTNVLMESMEH